MNDLGLAQVESIGYKSYSCPICHSKFKCQFNLDKHLRRHNQDPMKVLARPFICNQCGYATTSDYNLQSHVQRRHSQGDPSQLCTFCGKTFRVLYDLNFHVKKYHDEASLCACDLCEPPTLYRDPLLFSPVKLQLHLRKVHNYKNGPVSECPSCQFVCSAGDSARLVEHFRLIHMEYKQFGCGVCNKRFPKTSNVKYHILRVHDGKGNMDGKLKTEVGEDYFAGRNIIKDFKETDPESYPNKMTVITAMEKARELKLMPVLRQQNGNAVVELIGEQDYH